VAGVLTIGSTTVDFVFHVDGFPTKAEKHRAVGAEILLGGCAANAAVTIARLGGMSLLAADIGDDHTADIILKELAKTGVDTQLVRRVCGARSSCSTVQISADGERMILNYRGQGLHQDAGLVEHAPQVGAVLVDARWPAGAVAGLAHAAKNGIPGIIDVEAGIDPALLGKATHLAFSAQGARALYPDQQLGDAIRKAAAENENWACVTDGEHGVLFSDGSQITHRPGFDITAVDTLGAGDTWHGAFALLLAEGADEQAAIRFASATAALKCTKSGGHKALPDRQTVHSFLEENKDAA
jgi:sulfofructose kinase